MLLAVAALGEGAPENADLEESKGLVVRLLVETQGGYPDYGAGVVFGLSEYRVYILTAGHVVEPCLESGCQVRVEFLHLPGEEGFEANVLKVFGYEGEEDLAVLSVDRHGVHAERAFRFERLGTATTLSPGDTVYAVGNPEGTGWRHSDVTFSVQEVSERFIDIAGKIRPGHSGGALLDSQFSIVGVLKTRKTGGGGALRIDRVLKRIQDETQFPVNLSSPPPAFDLSKIEFGKSDFSARVPGKLKVGEWQRNLADAGPDQYRYESNLVLRQAFDPEFAQNSRNPEFWADETRLLFWKDSTVATFDAPYLNPVTVRSVRRNDQGHQCESHLSYDRQGKVSGTVKNPMPTGCTDSTIDRMELGTRVVDHALLVALIPTLPLAEGARLPVRAFLGEERGNFVVAVQNGGPIEVPAGSFGSTWRLAIENDPLESVYWVTKQERKLVQARVLLGDLTITLSRE